MNLKYNSIILNLLYLYSKSNFIAQLFILKLVFNFKIGALYFIIFIKIIRLFRVICP